jgi:hypothetical protein
MKIRWRRPSCLVLLMVHDRPFATGGITVQPNALREVGVD